MTDRQALHVALDALRSIQEKSAGDFSFELAHDLIGLPSIFPFDVRTSRAEQSEVWLAGVHQYASVHVQRLSLNDSLPVGESRIGDVLSLYAAHRLLAPGASGDAAAVASRWLRSHFYEVSAGGATDLVLARWNDEGKLMSFGVGAGFGDEERAVAHREFPCQEAPVREPARVIWAGTNIVDNYHFFHRSQRYAIDLEPLSDALVPVYAPIDGVVAEVADGEDDNLVGQPPRFASPGGNAVVIRCADITLHLCHFKRGSVQATLGQHIRAGTPIGVIGNSGNSSFPHLHVHAQQLTAPFHGVRVTWPLPEGCTLARGATLPQSIYAGTTSGSRIAS